MPKDQGESKSPLPWFRMYHEFSTDPKVQMLSEVDQRRFIMLLCIDADFPTSIISDADMAWRMRVPVGEWQKTKSALVGNGLCTESSKPTWDGSRRVTRRLTSAEWQETRARVFARDEHTCRYCNATGVDLECDHVIPVSRGGDNSDDNLVASCRPCNRAKRDKVVSIDEWSSQRRARS